MKVKYEKDDVWLAKFAGEVMKLRICEICGNQIRHKYGWESADTWHNRCVIKYGRVHRIFGIPIWTTRA